jgi:hypothetical protein
MSVKNAGWPNAYTRCNPPATRAWVEPLNVETDSPARDPGRLSTPSASRVSIRPAASAARAVGENSVLGRSTAVHVNRVARWPRSSSPRLGPRGSAFARVARRPRIDLTAAPAWYAPAVSRQRLQTCTDFPPKWRQHSVEGAGCARGWHAQLRKDSILPFDPGALGRRRK